MQRADDLDLDVVMISPDADPPVVRLVDFSKFKFEAAKAAKEASKKQRETRCARTGPSGWLCTTTLDLA